MIMIYEKQNMTMIGRLDGYDYDKQKQEQEVMLGESKSKNEMIGEPQQGDNLCKLASRISPTC